MSPFKATREIAFNIFNSSEFYHWKLNMHSEIFPAILLSDNLYMLVSISTMILTNIGAIFAVVFLALKNKFQRMTPLDCLTINLLVGCGLFSTSNFVTYSYGLFNRPTPANTCILVQTLQSIFWYNEFFTIILITTERIYNYTSPISHMKKFSRTFLVLVITASWLVAACLGVLSSFPYNWNKIQLSYSLELCHCESLIFKKADIAIQVGSLVIPYILMLLFFPIARFSALKDAIQVRKDLGLGSTTKFNNLPSNDSFYAAQYKITIGQKFFFAFLLTTHTMKILIFLLKEFNNYQKVIHINTFYDDVYEYNQNPYFFPATVIGLLNLLFLLSPIYNLVCCILINKSFFKKSCYA